MVIYFDEVENMKNFFYTILILINSTYAFAVKDQIEEDNIKSVLIINSSCRFKFDWRILTESKSVDYYLATTPLGIENYPQANDIFKKVYVSNDLNSDLNYLFNDFKSQANSSNILVLTHDEELMSRVAILRDENKIQGPGLETIRRFTNKIDMKECLADKGIRLPRFVKFNFSEFKIDPVFYSSNVAKKIGSWPLFAKPISSTCSQGVKLLKNNKDFIEFFSTLDPHGQEYEIDEYIDGELFHVDSLIQSGVIKWVQVSRASFPCAKFFQGHPLGSITLDNDSNHYHLLDNFHRKVLSVLNPPDGMIHMEIFKTCDEELVFLEVGARPAGAMVPYIYERHRLVNIQEMHYKSNLGIDIKIPNSKGCYGASLWFPYQKGMVGNLTIPKDIKSEYEVKWFVEEGAVLEKSKSVRDRIGQVVLFNEDLDELEKDFTRLSHHCWFEKPKAFLLHQNGRIKFNMKGISEFFDIHLVISPDSLKNIEESNMKNVFKILETNCFSLENIKKLIGDEKNCFITTIDESLVKLLGELRKKYGFEGFGDKNYERFKNKVAMKEKMFLHNIKVPRYISFNKKRHDIDPDYIDQIWDELGPNIFIKPIDGAGSENTTKITCKEHLHLWTYQYDEDIDYEMDEYISGDLFHIDSIHKNGNVITQIISKYSVPNAEFLEGSPLGSIPLKQNDPEREAIKVFANKSLAALSPIPDGVTHMEVFKKKNKNLVFLEIAIRPPGAMITEMYIKSLGVNFQEIHAKLQLGLEVHIPSISSEEVLHTAWMWFPHPTGCKRHIFMGGNLPILKSQINTYWKFSIGQEIPQAKDIRDRVGGILLWNTNYNELKEDFDKLKIRYNYFVEE